jgi:hypothetical protein
MIKVQVLTQCKHCGGDAYLPVGDAESYTGEIYIRYQPYPQCQGSGNQTQWVSLHEFAELLEHATSFEPDYLELAKVEPVSQYADSCDAAGI